MWLLEPDNDAIDALLPPDYIRYSFIDLRGNRIIAHGTIQITDLPSGTAQKAIQACFRFGAAAAEQSLRAWSQ